MGRELSETSPEIHHAVEKAFGSQAVSPSGLNRQYLREVIFADSLSRQKLEAILHPIILKEFHRQAELMRKAGESVVICEAALLIESGTYQKLDALIVVLASEATRLQRIQIRDGITEALAKQMIQAQVTDDKRKSLATYTIENNSTLEELEIKTRKLAEKLR